MAGIAAAVFLYRKDTTFSDQPKRLRIIMAFLRGVVVTVLASLLLAPLLKLFKNHTEEPVIIIAQDQSTSIKPALAKLDSTAYMQSLEAFAEKLSGKFQVHKIGFGDEVTPVESWTINDQASDMGELMTYLEEQYKGQNVGAIIVASDGAINRGRNPLYLSSGQKAPMSVIALGDTIRKTDLQIRDVFHNSIAYIGDKFSVQIDLAASRLDGTSTSIEVKQILDNQQVLLEKIPLQITSDDWFDTKQVTIEARQGGVQRYRVQLAQVRNEVTYVNNVRDFFVEVIDGRLKVLLLANSPHPDLAVWKAALLEQRNYEVDVRMASDFAASQLKGYDLVVLHQLPSSKYLIPNILDEINKLQLPKIFVAGYQTDLYALNNAQTLLRIDNGGNRTPNDVTMIYNPGFNAFNTSDDLRAKLESFSPLVSPYGDYSSSGGAQVFAYQRIGKVDTQFPLIVMEEKNDIRTCVIAGEGIWKWQLYDQLQNGSKEITHELLTQICQYASTKSDKRKFRVTSSKKIYTELEDISFQAELYNDNYELINTPEVFLKIRNKDRQEFDYSFNISGDAYALQVGKFPEGSYSYTATTELNGIRHTHDGKFVVQPVQLEAMSTTADHGLLRQLAEKNGGQFLYPAQMDRLADEILENETIKPIFYSSTQTRPLIHLKWLCLLLLAGLTVEWFLRRYYGGY
jgi:hypothetical protein